MARPNPSVSNCGLVIVQVQPEVVQQRLYATGLVSMINRMIYCGKEKKNVQK